MSRCHSGIRTLHQQRNSEKYNGGIVCSISLVHQKHAQYSSTTVQYNGTVQRYSTTVKYNGTVQRYSTAGSPLIETGAQTLDGLILGQNSKRQTADPSDGQFNLCSTTHTSSRIDRDDSDWLKSNVERRQLQIISNSILISNSFQLVF